jgi:hypothetical protein
MRMSETVLRVRIPISPPHSLNCRETASPLPQNTQHMPVFRNISFAKRTGENGLLGTEWRHSAGLSPEGASAVRFQGGHEANAMRSQTDDAAKGDLTW